MKRAFLAPLTMWRCLPRGVLAGLAASLACAAALPACVGPEGVPRDNTAMLRDDQRVSSVPWSKPPESQSQFGRLAEDPRIGGGTQ